MRCPQCRTPMDSKRENYRYTESGLPNVTLRDIEVRSCPNCGERAAVLPRIEDLHRTLADALIRARARLAPAEIRFLRKHLGFSGADFARHMGVSAETVSRWESEREPQPMGPPADRLLRLMVAHGQQVEEYPLAELVNVAQDGVPSPRLTARATRGGWQAEAA